MENLTIGAESWLHKDWEGSFYPEGMPEDWRLDFYSNQFYCVLVPEEDWLTWGKKDLEDIAEALEGESFAFIFKLTEKLTCDDLKWLEEVVKGLSGLSIRLLIDLQVLPLKSLPILLKNLPMTYVEPLSKEGKIGWSWSIENQTFSGEPFGCVSFLPQNDKGKIDLLKSFMYSLPKNLNGAPFIVSGDKIKGSSLSHLKTLSELLGF